MILNDKLGKMLKEVVIAYFKLLPQICMEGLRETIKNLCQGSLPQS